MALTRVRSPRIFTQQSLEFIQIGVKNKTKQKTLSETVPWVQTPC